MNLSKTLPAGPLHLLERDRLMSRLLSWEDRKLVLIHGQAGQGKSTLAAEYVRTLREPSLWYTLGQEDVDPNLFLACLDRAIRNVWPACAPHLPPVPRERHGIDGLQQGLKTWLQQVFGGLPGPSLLVFDDCHHASSSPILLQILQTLIDHTPPQVRFIVLSRVRPELAIARLRATQSVGELANEDLKFNAVEVRDLFTLVFRMHLSENEAALITGTTEGWPAGLALLHEYLSTLPVEARTPALFNRRPDGFHTHVFDYLAQEVFGQLPGPLRQFLLRTSITDQAPLPLVKLLTGLPPTAPARKASIATITGELFTRNLFAESVDDNGPAVRYHSLFREFLRKKLATETRPRDVARLYTIAARYFQKSGDPVRSIDLLLAAGRFDQAVKHIEYCGEALISRGLTQTLIRWTEALPLEYGNRPWLLLYRAAANRFTAPRIALDFYGLALQQFQKKKTSLRRTSGLMHSLCGVIESCFHGNGDFTRMARMADQAQTLLARRRHEPSEVRARLLLAMGTAWFFIGRLDQASRALKQASALFRKHGDPLHRITSAIYLTPCLLYQGDFQSAREVVQDGFETLAAIPDETGSKAALFLIKAMTALFEGDFLEAQESLDRCSGLADLHALGSIGFLSLDIGGWLKIAQGDFRGAELLLTELKRRGERTQNAFFTASAAHLLAIAYLFQKRYDKAKAESDLALSMRTQNNSKLFHAIYLIVSGAIHAKLGMLHQAEKDLLASLAMLKQAGAAHQEANAHLVLAGLYKAMNRADLVRKHLQAGFSLGRDQGFTYYALFDSAELSGLAGEAVACGICAEYCSGLKERLAGSRSAPRIHVHCLGAFRVTRDRTRISDAEWKGKQTKSLLKLLVAHHGRKLPRERVGELLWPERDADKQRSALNSTLHQVRKVLKPEAVAGKDVFCIRQENELIALNSDLVWTDVGQFLSHLDKAGRMRADRDRAKIMEEYEKAVSLYQGDFLPDDLYTDWAGPMREELRRRYLKTLEQAAALTESAGDRAKTLAFYEKIFLADPTNEEACCRLMTRYLSDGRRNEAIRTYERCERALSQDMDLEPEMKTKKLYRSIIGG